MQTVITFSICIIIKQSFKDKVCLIEASQLLASCLKLTLALLMEPLLMPSTSWGKALTLVSVTDSPQLDTAANDKARSQRLLIF